MKNKKSIIAMVAVCILGIVGTTIAYYTTNKNFENVFRTSDYSVSVTEEFESPNDWIPGTTTDKKVIATNTGNVDAAVRVSYVESWEDADGNSLPLVDNQSPAERYAIINFGNAYKWIESEEDGKEYYYYKAKLAPGETTASFINSVTYNELANIDVDEDCEDDYSTCTLTLDGHAGGKYKLTITVETAQFDKYKEIWGTDVEIPEETPVPYTVVSGNLNTIGSEVCIDTECFYVIGQEDEDHVKLLSKWNLNVGNNPKGEATNLQDSTLLDSNNYSDYRGTVRYSYTRYWNLNEDTEFNTQYGDYVLNGSNYNDGDGNVVYPYIYTNKKENGSYLNVSAEYIDNYAGYFKSHGLNATGRLLSMDEVDTIIDDGQTVSPGNWLDSRPGITGKEWIYSTNYWIGNAGNRYGAVAIEKRGILHQRAIDIYGEIGVRPVMIMEK